MNCKFIYESEVRGTESHLFREGRFQSTKSFFSERMANNEMFRTCSGGHRLPGTSLYKGCTDEPYPIGYYDWFRHCVLADRITRVAGTPVPARLNDHLLPQLLSVEGSSLKN
jgi:hypothetical protein